VAQLSVDPSGGAPGFDAAVAAANRLLSANGEDVQSLRLLADAYHGRATVAHLTNNLPDHVALATRQIEVRERLRTIGRSEWQDEASLARAVGQLALALEQRGDYEAALSQLDRARTIIASAMTRTGRNQMLERGLAEIRSRKVPVLLSLQRRAEAGREAEAAIDLLQPLVASDQMNIQYRADLAYAWLRLGETRRAEGRLAEALALHQRALAVRRERAERHSGFIFVPWELTRSLNSVGELLLAVSPHRANEAAALFAEARQVGLKALETAPSYTQVRKQVAVAEEGLAKAVIARAGAGAPDATAMQKHSVLTWRAVVSRSAGDERSARELARLEALVASGIPAPAPRD
jgi:tetratricopeptide (TPR) repeat protein